MIPETGQTNWAIYDRCHCGATTGEACTTNALPGGRRPRDHAHTSRPYTLAESLARGLPTITPLDMSEQGVPEVEQEPRQEVLVDELREELRETYAQAELDQDRTPTEDGYITFLARRAEEQSGGAAALRADVVTSVLDEVEAVRQEFREYAAKRFVAGGEVHGSPLRKLCDDEARVLRNSWLARLDRIASLVRGEHQ